jgi:hypothetical protein
MIDFRSLWPMGGPAMELCPELARLYGFFYEAREYSERLVFQRYGNYPPDSTPKKAETILGRAVEATAVARLMLVQHAAQHGCGEIKVEVPHGSGGKGPNLLSRTPRVLLVAVGEQEEIRPLVAHGLALVPSSKKHFFET